MEANHGRMDNRVVGEASLGCAGRHVDVDVVGVGLDAQNALGRCTGFV